MRIVSVWLLQWPILRFLAAQKRRPSRTPVDPEQPFVLVADGPGGGRIAAVNRIAEALGLAAGQQLADARAKAGMIQVRPVDPAADEAALRKLALWATRYTPVVAAFGERDGADGLFLDVTGAVHLFGGEEALLTDLARRLADFGLRARLAIASTPGAAWALSRFHLSSMVTLPRGQEAATLAPFPIEALRLAYETRVTLKRLGFKRVSTLIDKPRDPFAARFEKELLLRIDQALGRAAEPLVPVIAPPVYHSLRYLMEPIVTQPAIIAVATRLMKDLTHPLERDGVGARTLRLSLYRVDGEVPIIDIGLSLPTRDVTHVVRLIELKLERITEEVDAGFGFEALGLAVTSVEKFNDRQEELTSVSGGAHDDEHWAELIDTLRQRLGPRSVKRLAPVESHLPERAETPRNAFDDAPTWSIPDKTRQRPLLLLPQAESAAEVVATVPDGPPRRFRWRGVMHDVVNAQGPERVASEWWRSRKELPTRDYYLVEDRAGHRFWLFRQGLYGRGVEPTSWFVHGLFA